MIDIQTYRTIRQSTCAVVKSDIQLWDRDPTERKPDRVTYEIVGTGFVFHEDLVITNRHVFEGLLGVPNDRVAVMFVNYDSAAKDINITLMKTHYRVVLSDSPSWPGGKKYLNTDIALYQLDLSETDKRRSFLKLHPALPLGQKDDIQIGASIGLCGYLYGNELSLDPQDPSAWRISPLLHQGYISGVAPFDNVDDWPIKLFLTNITNGGGFSGSPIFLPNGNVIGIHCAGLEQPVVSVDSAGKVCQRSIPLGVGFAIPMTSTFFKETLINEWKTSIKATLEHHAAT